MELMPRGFSHVVTIGTTPPGMTDDVVAALIKDLKPAKPDRVVVLATADSEENARRLLAGVGSKGKKGTVRLLESAQSLDVAYRAANEEIARLIDDGISPDKIILHYTAGTKVMSAGAVLAAVNNDLQSMRYLYSTSPRKRSVPVTTPTRSVLVDKQLRLARTLLVEMRFRSAGEMASGLEEAVLTAEQSLMRTAVGELAHAYEDWDRFRVGEFLKRYCQIDEAALELPGIQKFRISKKILSALEQIGKASQADGVYPDELLIDLLNNAQRRLMEGRPDDALIRLHRAAELYAQHVLMADHGIRTDNVEIRKVPPRSRPAYEAERRLDDARIKIGLRKSYELLEILGNPIGTVYREHEDLRVVLDERRNLVLAHGTRPASMQLALQFMDEVKHLLKLRIKNLDKRMKELQFPWVR